MGQTEHGRMSPWGQQQGRASGLGAIIQTVALAAKAWTLVLSIFEVMSQFHHFGVRV